MKHTHITRLSNPYALDIPEIKALFEKAFKHDIPAPVDGVIEELRQLVASPATLCVIGWEDMEAKGLVIAFLPRSKLFLHPQTYHFYNSGSAKLRNDMLANMLDWTRENGYNDLFVANWTGAKDEVFERSFRKGNKMHKIGAAYVLEFD